MATGSAPRADDEPRHGFLVGDVRVLIPRAIRSQYLPKVSVFPVPRATPRLRGLVHWRGQAVVAIDAADPPAPDLPVIGICNLLLIGPDDDAISLVQSAPPSVVHLTDALAEAAEKPDCWIAQALVAQRVDVNQQAWWELDLAQFVQCMHDAQMLNDAQVASAND